MKSYKCLYFAIPFYLVSALCVAAYLFAEIHPNLVLRPANRLLLLGVFCICAYIGSRILCNVPAISRHKVMRRTFLLFFIAYLSLLLTFTLFDPMFGRDRQVHFIFSDRAVLKNYLANSFNILPLATIFEYVKALFTGSMHLSIIATNLLGNLLALTPMALFLPMFIRKCEKFIFFLLATSLTVLCIEMLQFVFNAGFCDIDDLILNVSGACIAFVIFKTKPVKRLIGKLVFMMD